MKIGIEKVIIYFYLKSHFTEPNYWDELEWRKKLYSESVYMICMYNQYGGSSILKQAKIHYKYTNKGMNTYNYMFIP